jgi:hypothetical protein
MIMETEKRCSDCKHCKVMSGEGWVKKQVAKIGKVKARYGYFYTRTLAGVVALSPEELKGYVWAKCMKRNWIEHGCNCIVEIEGLAGEWYRNSAELCFDFEHMDDLRSEEE